MWRKLVVRPLLPRVSLPKVTRKGFSCSLVLDSKSLRKRQSKDRHQQQTNLWADLRDASQVLHTLRSSVFYAAASTDVSNIMKKAQRKARRDRIAANRHGNSDTSLASNQASSFNQASGFNESAVSQTANTVDTVTTVTMPVLPFASYGYPIPQPNSNSNMNLFTPSFPTMDTFMAAQSLQFLNNSNMAPFLPMAAGYMNPSNVAGGVPSQPPGPSNTEPAPNTNESMPKSSSNGRRRQSQKVAPSKGSGGIPEPTDAYLQRASLAPVRRKYPGPLLVIIDLNGTLLYRPDVRRSSNFDERTFAKRFVEYCVQTFWVVIWSSSRPQNVQRMVDKLVSPDIRGQVVAIWGRDKFGLTPNDYNARVQCYKRLTTVWNHPDIKASFPQGRPGFEYACWDQTNTVLIDDSIEKARSEPHNAITLPEFTGEGTDGDTQVLPQVHDYLNELCYQEDVSAYMRANPFKMS